MTVAALRFSVGDRADGEAIRRLATRAAGTAPHGAVMLAEVDGEPIVAVSIADGHTVADPLRATAALVEQVRLLRRLIRVFGSVWAA
jgi:cobalamin biosynthesis protein CobT